MTDAVAQHLHRAAAFRKSQQMEAALAELISACRADPDHPQAAFGHAQIAFETWRPAAALFDRARALNPQVPDLIRNHALALSAEGEAEAADQLLDATLAQHPGWLEGHRALAAMRITGGEDDGWDRSYARAVALDPDTLSLRLAWFHQLALRKDWDAARVILDATKAKFGAQRGIDLSDIYLACESGEAGDMRARFAPYRDFADPGTRLCEVRHLLRTGDVAGAEALAAAQCATPAARMFWPYLDLCWRLLADPRSAWLHAIQDMVRPVDLAIPASELAALGTVLRALHRMRAPYPEQSVRGGTQTDRQLFFHPDPVIQNLRARIGDAVADYVGALPPADPGHPLLGERRNGPHLFEGSWSVRLDGGGYHASHTHILGWISSALYVALPAADALGEAPSGWLSLGSPPPELGLGLGPLARIEPKPGRLVLFPSTLWHATEPFQAGERLTVAFDVMLPSRTEGGTAA